MPLVIDGDTTVVVFPESNLPTLAKGIAISLRELRDILEIPPPDPDPDPEFLRLYESSDDLNIYGGYDPNPPEPPVEGWGAGSDVGTFNPSTFDFVPGRDSDGVINAASIQSLPLFTWVRVPGTQLNNLVAAIVNIGGHAFSAYDWANGKDIRNTFDSWVGCATNGVKIYYPRGGGHADSSVNGTWVLDVLKMLWGVQDMPSYPNAPGAEWVPEYRVVAGSGGNRSYTNYYSNADPFVAGSTVIKADVDGMYRDNMPDGRPSSTHQYNGVWFDSRRNCIGTGRVSKWTLDLTSNVWTRERWLNLNGTPRLLTINQHLFYHEGQDALFGRPALQDTDSYTFARISMAGEPRVDTTIPRPSPWAVNGALASCRLDEDRALFIWTSATTGDERYAIYNMANMVPESQGLVGNGRPNPSEAEMMVALHVPTLGTAGQVIRRGTRPPNQHQWWAFDLETKSNVDYIPVGNVPAQVVWPGNKYLKLDKLGICLLVDDLASTTQPAICIMRYRDVHSG